MKEVAISSRKEQNKSRKNSYAEPSLKVNFVCDGKRIKKNRNFRRGKQSNALWRCVPDSVVLQKTPSEMAFARSNSDIPTWQALPSNRTDACNNLCSDLRDSSDKQDKNITRQWFLSTDNRIKNISLCKQPEMIFKKSKSENNSRYLQSSRLFKIKNVLSTKSTDKFIAGFRFNCFDNLWEVYRGSQSRIQSAKKRSAFISSAAMFRISQERVLAWDIKTRRCLYFNWFSEIFRRMFGKDTALCLSCPGARGFRFFRPQIYRAVRRQMHRLRHCGKTNAANKKKTWRIKILSFPEGLGCFNFSVSTTRLGKPSQVYIYSQKVAAETRGPTEFIYSQTIFLSGFCKQSFVEAGKCLVFLQRESEYRKTHQRIKRRLCFGKDSDQKFSGKSDVFSLTCFSIQHYQLVQKDLFTKKISEINSPNHTVRDINSTCEIGQYSTQKCFEIAERIYSGENLKWYYSAN